jgi:hypothetical protein
MNKSVLKILVGFVALALAACAAFFSIVGLSKLFAGAMVAVIAMASTLEISKLVIASYLYQQWKVVNKTLRVYLISAITIIAIITSIGIYGFLSGAYQNTKSKYDLTQSITDSLSVKKSYFDSGLVSYQSQLESKTTQLNNLSSIRNSQEQRAANLINSNKSFKSVEKSASNTDKSIKILNKEIAQLNDSIVKYSTESSKLKLGITQASLKNELSSELGSLTYISKVLNVPMDKVVNILIILFMIVFDPLAICMVIAYNQLNESKSTNEDNLDNFSDKELADIVKDIQSETPQEPIDSIPMDIVPQEPIIDEEAAKIAAKIAAKLEAKQAQDRSVYGVKIY